MDEKEKLKEDTGKNVPVAVKIDPDMGDDQIKDLSDLFIELQIDAIIATNTTISRKNISDHLLSDEKGGLSGSPLNTRSNEVIAKLHTELKDKVPIIGVGGINSKKDAEEKLSAGASLIQVYTGLIYQGPALINQLTKIDD
jgi:dihydroorotate dehydrogenase